MASDSAAMIRGLTGLLDGLDLLGEIVLFAGLLAAALGLFAVCGHAFGLLLALTRLPDEPWPAPRASTAFVPHAPPARLAGSTRRDARHTWPVRHYGG